MDVMTTTQRRRRFFKNIKTEIFKRWHHIAQWQGAAVTVNFQPKLVVFHEQPRDFAVIPLHREQANHVARGLVC